MPHLVILYTPSLDRAPEQGGCDMTALCRALVDTMLRITDEAGKQVFPTGGVRVLAYPAAHSAVADGGAADRANGGDGDYAFVYLNLRMGRGRPEAVRRKAGDALAATAKSFFEPLMSRRRLGLTLQIDEGPEVFDAKLGNLHPLFSKAP
jgi:5-carboxymethyl-2-hydroxymuconate isomerase